MRSGSKDARSGDVTLLYRRGLGIRAVVASAFVALFGGLLLLRPDIQISGMRGLQAVLIFLICVNPVLWWIGVARGFPIRDFYIHWAMDIGAVTLIVHYLGGGDVPITAAAYMVMIVSSATFSTWRTSWMLAGLAGSSYGLLVYAEHVGAIGHYHVGSVGHSSIEAQLISAAGAILFFFVFAYLAGTLATQLKRRSDEIALQKVEIEKSLQKEQASREGLVALSTIVQHDVYGPLGVVAGACKEARIGCDSGDIREAGRWLAQIEDRLRSIESAVESLGLFGVEEDEAEAKVEVFEVVQQVIGDLRAERESRGVTIDSNGIWPVVIISRAALYHVLRNIVSNAIKSVPTMQNGRVAISSERSDVIRDGWRIRITDNGPGLPENVQAQLRSAPRDRVRLKERGAGGNFGVGLALAQVLARRWGGGISYEGTGAGATIDVWIPVSRVREPALPQA